MFYRACAIHLVHFSSAFQHLHQCQGQWHKLLLGEQLNWLALYQLSFLLLYSPVQANGCSIYQKYNPIFHWKCEIIFQHKLIFIKKFQCILSSVIVVALKGVLFQVKDFPGILKKSKLDGLLWVGPFFGVILLDIKLGFVICISLAILIMTYRNYKIDILEFGIEDDDSHSTSQSNSSNSSVLRVSCTIHFTIFISQFYKI